MFLFANPPQSCLLTGSVPVCWQSMLALSRLYLTVGDLDACQQQCVQLLKMDTENDAATVVSWTAPCNQLQTDLASSKTRDTSWWQHCVLRCCPAVAKHGNIVARRVDTRNVSQGGFHKQCFCPGHKICVRQKRCVRGKTSQHLGNTTTSAMLPPQCVLVLPAL